MKKILVVEDESTLREGIATAFRDRGWHVAEASDAELASGLLQGEVYDVVVTDYRMPGGSGLDVVRRCRLTNEGTVVVMTAA